MDEKSKFKFSLANLLWMMVPLACIFAAVSSNASSASFVILIGVPAAIGALVNGKRGMWQVTAWCLLAMFVVTICGLGFALLVRTLNFFFFSK